MRSIALAALLFAGTAATASAQTFQPEAHGGDVALTYQWVRSNTQPGQCGCFGLNGAGISGSWTIGESLAAVAEVSGGYQGNGPVTGNSLTLVSYMAGARYWVPQSLGHGPHHLEPFAQVLVGAAHAGGGIAGAGDGDVAFAGRVGGGLDLPLSPRLAARVVQIDYYATKFANSTNDHQNNLLIGVGIVYRWFR